MPKAMVAMSILVPTRVAQRIQQWQKEGLDGTFSLLFNGGQIVGAKPMEVINNEQEASRVSQG